MLKRLGTTVEKRPWLIIGIVLMITIGFGSLLPALEMETSTEDFMPDTDIVNANLRVTEYFGQSGEMLMIVVENENAQSVVTPKALREEYRVLENLKDKFDEVDTFVSVGSFVDVVCQIEFGETLLNCTDEQIQTAYNDMMETTITDEVQMLQRADSNEEVDFNPYPKLSKGKNIDSLDIKNYYIDTNNESFQFSIDVYDLSEFKDEILSPHRKINVWEWYINFNNLIIPDERLDINYQIAAHIEPSQPLWAVGNGILENIKALFNSIRNRELRNSYKAEVYLWIEVPGQDMSFPIVLETGTVEFNTRENKIEIEVDKEELGKFGIAPKFGSFQLPAKLGETKAGVRVYQSPILSKPWGRVNVNISFIKRLIQGIQNRPIINSISTNMLQRFGDFSWENFDELFDMLETGDFKKEALSLKDMSNSWVILDEAPDNGASKATYFIKPPFLEDIKSTALIFLSQDVNEESGPSLTLMMITLNIESTGAMGDMSGDVGKISREIELELMDLDKEDQYLSMKITGNGIITNEMNDVTMDANMIIMPAIFVVISLILLVMFKRFSYIILPLASLGISIVWLFGTMVLLDISFNMMMVAVVPLLMGLGVDYSVHLFHNYRAELKNGKSPGPAIISSIQDIGMAMFLATITTVIAFLSFLSASIPPLRDFGILCAIGIIYTFITAITFQASVRYLLDRNKTAKIMPKNNNKISLDAYMEKFSNIVLHHRRIIFVCTMLITILMASGASQVKTTFDMNDFLPEGNESLELLLDIVEFFPSSSESQEYILIEGNVATVEALKGIAQTHDNLKDDEYVTITPTGAPKELSIISIIRDAVRDNASIASEFHIDSKGIPESDSDVVGIYNYLYDREEYMLNVLSVLHRDGTKYDATVIRIYTSLDYSDEAVIDSNKQMKIVYNNLQNDMVTYGDTDAIVTGEVSSTYIIMNSMTDSQILSTIISILLAAIVLVIVFRNPILGLITVAPVGICIIWITGTIYYLGYSFNIMTIMVTSLTIGIGIDYAIHATQRFRLTADRTGNVQKAVSETIGHTGGALFIAAITTAAGFSMLILAPMPPEQQFGIITSMTIVYSYICSILILPPILMKWGEWRKKRKGFIISPRRIVED